MAYQIKDDVEFIKIVGEDYYSTLKLMLKDYKPCFSEGTGLAGEADNARKNLKRMLEKSKETDGFKVAFSLDVANQLLIAKDLCETRQRLADLRKITKVGKNFNLTERRVIGDFIDYMNLNPIWDDFFRVEVHIYGFQGYSKSELFRMFGLNVLHVRPFLPVEYEGA